MKRHPLSSIGVVLAIVVTALAIAGCVSETRPLGRGDGRSALPDSKPQTKQERWVVRPYEAGTTPVSAHDPCSNRLHDLIGSFLLYHAMNHRFPDRLEELKSVGADVSPEALSCPACNKPYVYEPRGLTLHNKNHHFILHDPEEAVVPHKGLRFGLAVQDPGKGEAMVIKVVPISGPEWVPVRAGN
jgi:hypothetical protein